MSELNALIDQWPEEEAAVAQWKPQTHSAVSSRSVNCGQSGRFNMCVPRGGNWASQSRQTDTPLSPYPPHQQQLHLVAGWQLQLQTIHICSTPLNIRNTWNRSRSRKLRALSLPHGQTDRMHGRIRYNWSAHDDDELLGEEIRRSQSNQSAFLAGWLSSHSLPLSLSPSLPVGKFWSTLLVKRINILNGGISLKAEAPSSSRGWVNTWSLLFCNLFSLSWIV